MSSGGVRELIVRVGANISNFQREMQRIQQEMGNVQNRFKNAGEKITKVGKSLTTKLTVPLVAVGTASAKMAIDTEASMAKVNSILQLNDKEFTAYKNSLKQGAAEVGMAYSDYAEAAYSAISAGVKQADVTNFLTQSNKLAKGGLTDLATATDLLTTVQNAYGLSQKDMQHVSDVLIQTQNKGKTTVAELGASMGKIIPTANSLGVSVEQLGAGYAIMTSKGIATAETTTYMNAMFNELGKSGSTVDKVLREQTGQSFKELTESGKSTGDILQILSDYADKSGKSLSDLFSSSEAGKAALTLLSGGAEGFNEQLKGMIESTGACDKAFNTMNSTTKEKLAQSIAQLKNALSDIGEVMLPLISRVAEMVSGFAKWLAKLGQTHPALMQIIVIIGGLLAAIGPIIVIIGTLITNIAAIIGAFQALSAIAAVAGVSVGAIVAPVAGVIAAIGALIAIGVALYNNWDTIKAKASAFCKEVSEGWNQFKKDTAKAFSELGTELANDWNVIKTTVSDAVNAVKTTVINVFNSIKAGITKIINAIKAIITTYFNIYKTIITTVVTAIKTVVTTVFNAIKTIVSTVLTAIKTAITTYFNAYKTVISTAMNLVKAVVTGDFNAVKSIVTNVCSSIGSVVSSKFNAVKTNISNAINGAKSVVQSGLNAIKGFFSSCKLSLPKIALPHFSVSGKLSLNPPSVPKISVRWFKAGAVMTKPTLFGGGEAGPEGILPLKHIQPFFDKALANTLGNGGGDAILEVIKLLNVIIDVLKSLELVLDIDGKEFVRNVIAKYQNELDKYKNTRNPKLSY